VVGFASRVSDQLIVAGPPRGRTNVDRIQLDPGVSFVTAGLVRKSDNQLGRSPLLVEDLIHDKGFRQTAGSDGPHPQTAMDRPSQPPRCHLAGNPHRSGSQSFDLIRQGPARHQDHPQVRDPYPGEKPDPVGQGATLLLIHVVSGYLTRCALYAVAPNQNFPFSLSLASSNLGSHDHLEWSYDGRIGRHLCAYASRCVDLSCGRHRTVGEIRDSCPASLNLHRAVERPGRIGNEGTADRG
jgi:hypothetical protein